tara:strand:+ start:5720 stop:7150 length:1431 start_codon:yes stop_codon:yes gene_type:complete
MSKVIPVILCGGIGTRLWPLSRKSYPKQFLSLYGESKISLLQKTYQRISILKEVQSPIIVCNEEHRFLVAEQMRNINVIPKAIILEPKGKNTGPAIALGTFKALEEDKNAILLILSADHIIQDENIFRKTLEEGFKSAEEGNLVTFGVIPTKPEPGYGYIESELNLDKENIKGSKIKKFIEKPNKDLACKLFSSKKYTWNSGIFVFKTKVIIDEFEKHAPLISEKCKKAIDSSKKDLDFIRIDKKYFLEVPSIPFDIAVMEKTENGIVIPLNAGWSDIGTWESLWHAEKKDSLGNVIEGNILNHESQDCYLRSESRLLVTLGLKNMIIVETSDAVLAAEKNHCGEIKSIVNQLVSNKFKEGTINKKVYRPWGSYTSLVESQNWLVKSIEVNPGSKLSLQKHHHRVEHWIVVKGIADVQIGENKFKLEENQSTFIPKGEIHRLSNSTRKLLTLIEVQSGDYIGEDDIERLQDNYGRS